MDTSEVLIDQNRITEVTEVAFIDGGKWADVLAVSYGPGHTRVRIRFEETGNRNVYVVPADKSLEEVLHECAEGLYRAFPYDSKPVVTVYREHQARTWVRWFIAELEKAVEADDAAGGMSEEVGDGGVMRRVVLEVPTEPNHRLN